MDFFIRQYFCQKCSVRVAFLKVGSGFMTKIDGWSVWKGYPPFEFNFEGLSSLEEALQRSLKLSPFPTIFTSETFFLTSSTEVLSSVFIITLHGVCGLYKYLSKFSSESIYQF